MNYEKMLDGPVEDVKTRLSGVSHDDLLKLRDAEQAGQKRDDVLAVINQAIGTADAARAGGFQKTVAGASIAADLDTSGPANIAAATTFSTSGAPVQLVPDVDPSHPAVDNNPRERTTAQMNRIDFNDPTIAGHEASERNLKAQSQG